MDQEEPAGRPVAQLTRPARWPSARASSHVVDSDLPDDLDDAPRRPRRRGIYLLPNLFTTAALFAGFYAIVQAMNARFEIAAIAIYVAMVLDGMDGRVARWTRTQSEFGAETTACRTWFRSARRPRW